MLSGDPLEFALVAIMRVAEIASKVGAEAKRQRCGDPAAELMMTADYLDNDISTQEHQLPLRVSKLLRELKFICAGYVSTHRGIPGLQACHSFELHRPTMPHGGHPDIHPVHFVSHHGANEVASISLEASSRICLTMQDAKLQKSGFEPLQQMSEHVRGISLATVLAYCHLTARMKVALAYILAPSIWQY